MANQLANQVEELLTVQEVASILRVDQTTVRRWIKEGTLPSIRLPHRGKREIYRVRRSTLNEILS
ncbi:MAG TPA: helix-turn-helix domain-containing protein [Ktedonobacteraceae bacterium]|jgi:excisionase family DNA binding protein|nr:helix-turn-helix domain-containing protein [Ktedonobacteraceae bacterium]